MPTENKVNKFEQAVRRAERAKTLVEVREALMAAGVEAAAKRRWEMSQSTGPFAALGPSWEDLKRDVHLRERADLKPQYERALVASRREIETAVDAALATLTPPEDTTEAGEEGDRWPGVPGRWLYKVRYYGGNVAEVRAPGLVEAAQLAAESGRVVRVEETYEPSEGSGAPLPEARWRVGRKVGRTIYLQKGPEPSDDDSLIGTMDSPQFAARAVAAVNATTVSLPSDPAPLPEADEGPVCSCGHAIAEHFMAANPATAPEHTDGPIYPCGASGCSCREFDYDPAPVQEDCDDLCAECKHERFAHMVNDEDPGPCAVCGCAAFKDAAQPLPEGLPSLSEGHVDFVGRVGEACRAPLPEGKKPKRIGGRRYVWTLDGEAEGFWRRCPDCEPVDGEEAKGPEICVLLTADEAEAILNPRRYMDTVRGGRQRALGDAGKAKIKAALEAAPPFDPEAFGREKASILRWLEQFSPDTQDSDRGLTTESLQVRKLRATVGRLLEAHRLEDGATVEREIRALREIGWEQSHTEEGSDRG